MTDPDKATKITIDWEDGSKHVWTRDDSDEWHSEVTDPALAGITVISPKPSRPREMAFILDFAAHS